MLINKIYELLDSIKDPEIPVISICELGIVRDITIVNETVYINITPTYSGCPAMAEISDDIIKTLNKAGYAEVEIRTIFSPAWTTDWMSPESREKLKGYGIAPPHKVLDTEKLFNIMQPEELVSCPFCNSGKTKRTSEFGSTACKALYFCNSCMQPFEYFKGI